MTGTSDQLDEAVLLSVLSDLEGGDFSVRMPIGWTGARTCWWPVRGPRRS